MGYKNVELLKYESHINELNEMTKKYMEALEQHFVLVAKKTDLMLETRG